MQLSDAWPDDASERPTEDVCHARESFAPLQIRCFGLLTVTCFGRTIDSTIDRWPRRKPRELLAFCLTPGNTDDRTPLPRLIRRLFGRLFADKGYVSQPLAEALFLTHGLRLITKLRKNMRNRLLPIGDKLLLRKRALIETIVDQLKNICQIEHSRHRSPLNFVAHLMAGLIAYCHQPKKPSLHLDTDRLLVA